MVYRASEKTGEVVAALSVSENDDLVCITSQGNTLKLRLADIAVLGKTAMGVHIVNITRPDLVVGVARVMKEDEDGVREAEEAARAEEARAAAARLPTKRRSRRRPRRGRRRGRRRIRRGYLVRRLAGVRR